GRLGGEWLAKAPKGKGNVVENGGIARARADHARSKGGTEARSQSPGIKVVKEVFSGWDFSKGGQQAIDLLNSSTKIDGIWTSGIDYTVVKSFQTLNKPFVPIVGAANNEFLPQLVTMNDKLKGAAVTNPATIGGVGTSLALDVLSGKQVERETLLTPQGWDHATSKAELEKNYFPDRDPTYSSQVEVKPYTHYTPDQLFACKGPGE